MAANCRARRKKGKERGAITFAAAPTQTGFLPRHPPVRALAPRKSPRHRALAFAKTAPPRPLVSTPSTPESSPVPNQARWFTEEVYPHDGQLKAYLRGSFPSVRDVDDVVQESYLRVWKARAVRPILSAKAFLFKVARHIALDSVQRGKVSLEEHGGNLAALALTPSGSGLAESLEAEERVHLLAAALITLPPRCRDIVMLRKLRGIPRKEVADRLGISEKTVDEQLARGVKRLEHYVRLHGGENRRAR